MPTRGRKNYIELINSGTGMSADDIEEVYLEIGTPIRVLQKQAQQEQWEKSQTKVKKDRPILGEKGVGRSPQCTRLTSARPNHQG